MQNKIWFEDGNDSVIKFGLVIMKYMIAWRHLIEEIIMIEKLTGSIPYWYG